MAAEYQVPDQAVVDYQCYVLDPLVRDPSRFKPLAIRGPRPERLEPGEYAACIGAAQTFGRFVEKPYPALLGERLGLPVLNISHGGAGPSFFCHDNDRLVEILNGARFVVLQAMSGRSESNSMFESRGVGHYRRLSDGTEMDADEAFGSLLRAGQTSLLDRLVAETRASWVASYQSLLARLTVPTVLFWFSVRKPDARPRGEGVQRLFGSYPQLVNGAMVDQVKEQCTAFASCTSRRGLPQVLRDRHTGEAVTVSDPWTATPWHRNWYYPSPEMHEDAVRALEGPCRRIAGLPPRRRFWFLSRGQAA